MWNCHMRRTEEGGNPKAVTEWWPEGRKQRWNDYVQENVKYYDVQLEDGEDVNGEIR